MENHKTSLTSAEMAGLWGQYMNDSATYCFLSFLLVHVDDGDTRSVIERGLSLSQERLQYLKGLFKEENFPIPVGFQQEEVNNEVPQLFSDTFCLYYLNHSTDLQITASTLAIGLATRYDIVEFHDNNLKVTVELQESVKEILLVKGLYIRPPFISMPKSVEFVTDQRFLGSIKGEQRALTSIEIGHLYFNIQTNIIGKELALAFQQVAKDKKVAKYFIKGTDIYNKHTKELRKILVDNHLPASMPWDVAVTDSKISPFSDKLMMYFITGMSAAGISKYSLAAAASPRRDIGLKYAKLLSDLTLYAEDGINLMINYKWLEEPPQAPSHKRDN